MAELHLDPSQIAHIAGKVAVVTGGASGIGKEVVDLLQQRGAIVYFCDLNVGAGNAVESTYNGKVRFVKADVSKWDELSAFFAFVKHYAGRIDLVFANAGYLQKQSLWDDVVDENGKLAEPELTTVEVTLKGAIYTAKLALHHFKNNPRPGGSLILTASTSSYMDRPHLPLYTVSKHGVLALLRSLRSLGPAGHFHVAGVAPGPTVTNMIAPAVVKQMEEVGIIMQQARYVALALVILASDPKWNGQILSLIGGKCFEIEDKIKETMPLWWGEWNTDQSLKPARINITGGSLPTNG